MRKERGMRRRLGVGGRDKVGMGGGRWSGDGEWGMGDGGRGMGEGMRDGGGNGLEIWGGGRCAECGEGRGNVGDVGDARR